MTINVRRYALGTELRTRSPWDTYIGGKAICSDGRVRALARIGLCADTFFSVPASVKVAGRTVAGYVTVETADGFSTWTDEDPETVKFHAYTYRKNHAMLPEGSWKRNAS